MSTIGTFPPGAKSLKLILAPPGMARPLSMGVMSLQPMSLAEISGNKLRKL